MDELFGVFPECKKKYFKLKESFLIKIKGLFDVTDQPGAGNKVKKINKILAFQKHFVIVLKISINLNVLINYANYDFANLFFLLSINKSD